MNFDAVKKVRAAAAICACALATVSCHGAPATGQVLAKVGDKDITLQDVRAEGRADGVPVDAGKAADASLLQRVVDRTLLAQSARDQKLDQSPDAPSDLARLQQSWLADKAARGLLKGMTPPTDAQAQAFITDHPYAFSKRQKVTARTITIGASSALYTQLKTYSSYDQALAFLRRLGVPLGTGTGTVDTAQLPSAVAAQIVAKSPGSLLITQPTGRIQLAEVQSVSPVTLTAQQQLDLAKRTLATAAASQRVAAELTKLKSQIHVTYQAGYAPTIKPGSTKPTEGS